MNVTKLISRFRHLMSKSTYKFRENPLRGVSYIRSNTGIDKRTDKKSVRHTEIIVK